MIQVGTVLLIFEYFPLFQASSHCSRSGEFSHGAEVSVPNVIYQSTHRYYKQPQTGKFIMLCTSFFWGGGDRNETALIMSFLLVPGLPEKQKMCLGGRDL